MDRDRMTGMFVKQFELCRVKQGETMVLLSDPEARAEYITAGFAAARTLGARAFNIAVAEAPQEFPDLCDGGPEEVAARYAERIEPLSDSRGSAKYRRRVIAAEVKRAVEDVWTRA